MTEIEKIQEIISIKRLLEMCDPLETLTGAGINILKIFQTLINNKLEHIGFSIEIQEEYLKQMKIYKNAPWRD